MIRPSSTFYGLLAMGTVGLLAVWPGIGGAAGSAPARHYPAPVSILPPSMSATPYRPAPAALAARIEELGRAFGPGAGIAVHDVQSGWTASYAGDRLSPQQSVSKLWVALAVFEALDRGVVRLDEELVVTRGDLTLFHQPIRAQVGESGYRTTVANLLERAMTQSDNTANDVLLRRVGGPAAVRNVLARLRIDNVRFGPGERLLQSHIAGISWRQAFANGNAFQVARAQLPLDARRRAIESYAANPIDGAAPTAIASALARLARGELLSPSSTSELLAVMERSKTGAQRLKAGTSREWLLAHKTGTGQDLNGVVAGFNDVGVLTAPDGRRYAVAVMIARTTRPITQRQQLIASVARVVTEHWQTTRPMAMSGDGGRPR